MGGAFKAAGKLTGNPVLTAFGSMMSGSGGDERGAGAEGQADRSGNILERPAMMEQQATAAKPNLMDALGKAQGLGLIGGQGTYSVNNPNSDSPITLQSILSRTPSLFS